MESQRTVVLPSSISRLQARDYGLEHSVTVLFSQSRGMGRILDAENLAMGQTEPGSGHDLHLCLWRCIILIRGSRLILGAHICVWAVCVHLCVDKNSVVDKRLEE